MKLTFRYLMRTTGIALIVVSLAMLPSIVVSVIYKEYSIALDFCKIAPIAFIIGLLMYKNFKRSFQRLRISDGLLMVTWGWIIAAIVGAFPFYISGCIPSFVDAFFESCSGFTTTGATVFLDVESLPYAILFWRSLTSWLGGIAILLLAIAIFPSLGLSGQSIMSFETEGPILEQPSPRRNNLSHSLIFLYLLFTAMEFVLLCFGGMNLFDSLIHSFGSVSTGGFSSFNDSAAHFSNYTKAFMAIAMFVSGINFNLYYQGIRGKFAAFRGDSELRLYLFFIFGPAALIFVELFIHDYYNDVPTAITDSFFQSISMLTTTGYTAGDYALWPYLCQVTLLILMFIGACSSSTGGGLKVVRFVIITKLLRHGISMRLHSQYYEAIKVNKVSVTPDKVSGVCNYTFLYIVMIFIGTLAVSFETTNMTTAFTAVVSCIGNIGPCFGDIGVSGYYGGFSAFSKVLLSVLMIAGRLELYTFFILFSPHYWTQKY